MWLGNGEAVRLQTLVPTPSSLAKLPAQPRAKRWAKPCFQKLTISIGGVLRFCPGLVAAFYLYSRGAHSRKAWTLAAGPEETGGGNLFSPTDPDRARARHDYVFPGFAHFRTERLSEPLTIYTASSLDCLEEGPWTRPNQAGPTRLIRNQGIIDTYLSVALLAQFRTAGHLGCLSFSCRPLANSIIEKPCYPRSCGCSARPPSSTLCMPPGRLRYLLQQVPAANRAESSQMTDRGQYHS